MDKNEARKQQLRLVKNRLSGVFKAFMAKISMRFRGNAQAAYIEPQITLIHTQEATSVIQQPYSYDSSVSTAVLYADGEHQKSGTYDRDQLAAGRAAMLLGYDPGHTRPH